MPRSAPGSSLIAAPARAARRSRGFTLIEVMMVLALIAIATGIVSLSMRDGTATRLEREAARLAALLETARAEARAAALPVRWMLEHPSTGAQRHDQPVAPFATRRFGPRFVQSGVLDHVPEPAQAEPNAA